MSGSPYRADFRALVLCAGIHLANFLALFPSMENAMPAKRTTHRSSARKKLYAERDGEGQFEDIQTYERAHGQDVKRRAKAEGKKKR
jgi:hypothetical protein